MSPLFRRSGPRVLAAFTVVSLLAFLAPSAHAAWSQDDVRVQLAYSPQYGEPEQGVSASGFLAGRTVRIEAAPSRNPGVPRIIGRREMRARDARIYTYDDVPSFVARAVRDTLTAWGAAVVQEGEDLVLRLNVEDFYVRDDGSAAADISIRAALRTPDGTTLWEGLVGGGGHSGRESYLPARSNAALRVALGDVARRMLLHPGLAWAVARAPRAPEPLAPAAAVPAETGAATVAPAGEAAVAAAGAASAPVPTITQDVAGGPPVIVIGDAKVAPSGPAAASAATAATPSAADAAAPSAAVAAPAPDFPAQAFGEPPLLDAAAASPDAAPAAAAVIASATPGATPAATSTAAPGATPAAVPSATPAAAPAATPRSAFAQELLRLSKAGLGEDVVVMFARQRTSRDDLSADDLLALRDAGVSDAVLRAALERPRP